MQEDYNVSTSDPSTFLPFLLLFYHLLPLSVSLFYLLFLLSLYSTFFVICSPPFMPYFSQNFSENKFVKVEKKRKITLVENIIQATSIIMRYLLFYLFIFIHFYCLGQLYCRIHTRRSSSLQNSTNSTFPRIHITIYKTCNRTNVTTNQKSKEEVRKQGK